MGGEKITIDKQLAEGLPTITSDANLLQQSLVNLMQNSLEAMDEVGTLGIRSWLSAKMNMLVVSISDTSGGVPPEVLSKVFEPFYSTKLDRLGLGLPVAYRIITEHGGFININTNEEVGARVNIYLPIIDDIMHYLSATHQQILNLQ